MNRFPMRSDSPYGLQSKARKWAKLLRKPAFVAGALILASVFLSIGAEWISRGSLRNTLAWLMGNRSIFMLNALLGFCVLLLLYSLIGSLFPAMAAATAVLSIVSLISYFKTKLIGEPFFPWDIFLNKEGFNIAPLVTGRNALLRVIAILFIIAILIGLRIVLQKFSISWKLRIVFGLLSIMALVSFGVRASWAQNMINRSGVAEIVWNQQENYKNNGLLLAFTLNVKNSIITKPAEYSDSTIATIAGKLTDSKQETVVEAFSAAASESEQQPNVIFIMNEAFWDPALLPDVTFDTDPIPTVRKLQNEFPAGYMISPQFGGGTSNVEFEILTGFSMSFLPSGSIPYQQYISRPVPSLASYFESQGYKSLAIHSYEGWFWNRENVYKWMGFEGFKSIAYFNEPEYKGAFIADDEVSRSIIEQIDNTDEPVFIYAVTMQNHGPYNDDRYGDDASIGFQGDLTEGARQILRTYSQGAHDADQALKLLIDHYQESEEPTLIVFYGDHLPMLGYDYDVYKQGGFIETELTDQWTLEELQKMRSVPFVTWANFDFKQESIPAISASFLGSYVLEGLSEEQQPGQFGFNAELYQEVPGLLRNLVIDADQELSQQAPDNVQEKLDDYRQLQYDMLFGEQYLARYMDSEYLSREPLSAYNSIAADAEAAQ